MKPIISIIVPIYNVEKYLHRCIDSILAQTFTNFELLLINDGSRDNSGYICEEYSKKDTRVKVYHKENGGVSSARNIGLDHAKGEWVSFIDSDDWVDPLFLNNYIEAISEEFDIILQSFWFEYENQPTKSCSTILPTLVLEGPDRLVRFLEEYKGVHNGFIWHRLFKREIIEKRKIRFAEGISFAEDGLWFFNYLKDTKQYRITSKKGYHYGIRGGSLTTIGSKYNCDVYTFLIKGYLDSLLDFSIPSTRLKEYQNFVKKYAWRLIEGWFIQNAYKHSNNRDQLMDTLNEIVVAYELMEVKGLTFLQRRLITAIQLKKGDIKDTVLKTLLYLRTYEVKLKRHLNK